MRPAIILLPGLNSRFPGFMRAATASGLSVLAVTPDARLPRPRILRHMWRTGQLTDFAAMRECVAVGARDDDRMLRQAQEWAQQYDLRAVISLTDAYLPLAALVADLMGIAGPSYRAARVSTDKFLQRSLLRDLSPAHRLVLPGERHTAIPDDLGFPLVSKPTGRTGSAGVELLTDATQATQRLTAYPADEAVLLEQRVQGAEFSVENVVCDGRVVFQGVTAKATNETETTRFVEVGHHVGPQDRTDYDELRRVAADAVERLDVGTGMAHVELRLDSERGPVLMELTARGGGDAIPALWELAMGVSLERILLEALMTGQAPATSVRRCAGQRFLPQWPGLLRDVHCEIDGVTPIWFGSTLIRRPVEPIPVDAPATIHELLIDLDRGAVVNAVQCSSDRVGSVIAHAPDETELTHLWKRCADGIRPDIEPTPEPA